MHFKLLMTVAILYGALYMGQVDTVKNYFKKKLFTVLANSAWNVLRSLAIVENQSLFTFGQLLITVTPTLADPEVYAAYRKLGVFLSCKYSNMTRVLIKLVMRMTDECRKAPDVHTMGGCIQLIIWKLKDADNKMIARMSAALVTLGTSSQVQSVLKMLASVRKKISQISTCGGYLLEKLGWLMSGSCENNLQNQLDAIDRKLSKVDAKFESFIAAHCFIERIEGQRSNLLMSDEKDIIDLDEVTSENLLPLFTDIVDTLTDTVVDKLHDRLGFCFNPKTNTSDLVVTEKKLIVNS